ncbi:MAG TPA: TonB family protein [Longimicrobium sp.]|nr:TonB family protein [Longimicrobium sp.]
MFKVLEGRKRRVMSPAAMVGSVAAHLLLLGGVVYAAANDTGPAEYVDEVIDLFPNQPPEPPPPAPVIEAPPPPAPEQPAAPDDPAPVAGERLELLPPTKTPDTIEDELPGVAPVDPKKFGDGPTGDVIGPRPVIPTPPTGNTVAGPVEDYVPDESAVEERPLLNREGLPRTMERYYPSVLRDSRVAGRVVVELIVNEDGRVRDGSARVMETTHPAFAEATLRAVERFRFRPAKMAGVPVAVRVTIPINWTVPR